MTEMHEVNVHLIIDLVDVASIHTIFELFVIQASSQKHSFLYSCIILQYSIYTLRVITPCLIAPGFHVPS